MLPLAARRALWAFAIFALVGLPVSAQSSQPWHFPDDQSRRDAQRKSKYWYEAYPVAVDAIDSRNPDRAELEDAVARLRVCIETYPREFQEEISREGASERRVFSVLLPRTGIQPAQPSGRCEALPGQGGGLR